MNKRVRTGLSMFLMCSLIIGTSVGTQADTYKFEGKIIEKSNISVKDMDSDYNKFLKIVEKNDVKIKKNKLEKEARVLKQKKEAFEARKNKIQKQNALSKGRDVEKIEFTLTFYTDAEEENSSAGGVNCKGKTLEEGMVASNVWKLGTRIKLEGYGEVYVADRGGSHFDNRRRLDVFVAKLSDENNSEYYRRVSNMGKPKVKGYIIN
ncbi:hypothetical protein [Clostridium tagluense]|uniref:3D domain-containing protein n=1 Tax=Clostridium tagluense TaxID=360422 RepID=A0A401UQD6_9CLOT|nr:hypothetical protein [Clostridium tagluense]GCD11730.1 hypothetical protein Ctaglu_33530 [Clostridium tagluense]